MRKRPPWISQAVNSEPLRITIKQRANRSKPDPFDGGSMFRALMRNWPGLERTIEKMHDDGGEENQ